jgi:DNA-binding NtrC family response regulator
MMRRVLLLDDEINVLNALQRQLRLLFPDGDVAVETFTDPGQAVLRASEVAFDVVMSDYRMAHMNGADTLQMIKAVQPDAVRMILSGSDDIGEVMNAVNLAEVFRYVAKPWDREVLFKAFTLAFERRDTLRAERRLLDEARASRGELTPQELEARRLEAEEPGIMKVNWGADGSVHLD